MYAQGLLKTLHDDDDDDEALGIPHATLTQAAKGPEGCFCERMMHVWIDRYNIMEVILRKVNNRMVYC